MCLAPLPWVLQLPNLGKEPCPAHRVGNEALRDPKGTQAGLPAQSWGGPRAWKSRVKPPGCQDWPSVPLPHPGPVADKLGAESVLCIMLAVQSNKSCPPKPHS